MHRHLEALLDQLAQVRLDAEVGRHAGQDDLVDARLAQLRHEIVGLGAALEAMLAHPERAHSLADLAALAGMSRSAFSTHFSHAFGQSPYGFLTENRLRRAARFLQTTELPIKTIASKIGYPSRSNFSRAFKALYGIDPNAYRQGAGRGASRGHREGVRGRYSRIEKKVQKNLDPRSVLLHVFYRFLGQIALNKQ